MQFIINSVKSNVNETDEVAISNIRKKFLKNEKANLFLYKKSIDARKKDDIKLVRSFLVETENKNLIKYLSSLKFRLHNNGVLAVIVSLANADFTKSEFLI